MDLVDVCEELGSQYGVLPHIMIRLPWVRLREIWNSYCKRKRRAVEYDVSLRGTSPEGMFLGGAPGNMVSLPDPPKIDPKLDRDVPENTIDQWASEGFFPVTIHHS